MQRHKYCVLCGILCVLCVKIFQHKVHKVFHKGHNEQSFFLAVDDIKYDLYHLFPLLKKNLWTENLRGKKNVNGYESILRSQ